MSSKSAPPLLSSTTARAGFISSTNSTTQFQPLLYNSIYSMGGTGEGGDEELNLASGGAGANFYTARSMKCLEEAEEQGEEEEDYGMGKAGRVGGALDMAAVAAHAQEIGRGEDDGGIGAMRRWGVYEQEKGSYSISPLMEIAGAAGRGACAAPVDYLPLSNSASTHSPFTLDTADFRGSASHKYSSQDMEILKAKQPLNTHSSSVQQLLNYDQHLPSSLGFSASLLASYQSQAPTHPSPSFSDHPLQPHHLQLLRDHHPAPPPQWSSSALHSAGPSHPHAELLLLPGVSDNSASPLAPHSAALPSSHLDLLHASSLHDKQAPLQQLPLGMGAAVACGGSATVGQMWNTDKLDMTVGLGLRDHSAAARSAGVFAHDVDHFARQAHAQSGLSLFLQSPHERAQAGLSLDAARYSSRTATGAVGVLRNSKYLRAAQQLLNEFCNVCKDVAPDHGKGSTCVQQPSTAASSMQAQHSVWSGSSTSNADSSLAGDDHAHLLHRALFSATQKDMSAVYPSEHFKGSIEQSSISSKLLMVKQPTSDHHGERAHAGGGGAASGAARGTSSPSRMNNPPLLSKQLPADERCHLQLKKARLIAMVEELDRRYQQYRDQMQLIITSFESATGMGAAATYTTLAKKAMSRQFRGVRDAISEHISKVCKLLGEEVSSVPILCRGETPRLRLVDQRLRHQRSLQQIGMLPQQQAWRPQRGLPERSVTVLRAWLFEHFLHPYPKDSEKSMLARLTGLSRNQVSNWFINARVRLWKPMVEEMYIEESKALELSDGEGSLHAAEVLMQGISPSDQQAAQSDCDPSLRQSWQHGTTDSTLRPTWPHPSSVPTPPPASTSFNHPEAVSFYNTRPVQRDDISSFMHLHAGHNPHAHAAHVDGMAEHQYSWIKGMQEEHGGDIGMLTHQHDQMGLQAAAMMQGQLNASAAFMKNGVSLTLGLQQPPPHSSYNTTSSAYGRPSEALLF